MMVCYRQSWMNLEEFQCNLLRLNISRSVIKTLGLTILLSKGTHLVTTRSKQSGSSQNTVMQVPPGGLKQYGLQMTKNNLPGG